MGATGMCQKDINTPESAQTRRITHQQNEANAFPPINFCPPREQLVSLQYIQPVVEEEEEQNLQMIMASYHGGQPIKKHRNHQSNESLPPTHLRKPRFSYDNAKVAQLAINMTSSHHTTKNKSPRDPNRSPKSILKKSHSKKIRSCSQISKSKSVHFQNAQNLDYTINSNFPNI